MQFMGINKDFGTEVGHHEKMNTFSFLTLNQIVSLSEYTLSAWTGGVSPGSEAEVFHVIYCFIL